MKQDISDQKQIYADYCTINKSEIEGYLLNLYAIESHKMKQKTSPRSKKASISQTDASLIYKW